MAAEYYVPGSITVLVTQFSPNPNDLLGYAYLGQYMLLTAPEKWFAILDSFSAISPTGTTLMHEVGHLFSKSKYHLLSPERFYSNIGSALDRTFDALCISSVSY